MATCDSSRFTATPSMWDNNESVSISLKKFLLNNSADQKC